MKVRPNASCPCGSGRKYKKCCLPKDQLETEASESITAPQHQDFFHSISGSHEALPAAPNPSANTWSPLPRDQIPEHIDSPEAFAMWLTPQQLQYLGQISILGEQGTQASVQQALTLFDAIPMRDQYVLFPLMIKPSILRILQQEQEAYRFCFQQLCEIRSERRWVENGGLIWEWLLSTPDPEIRTYVETSLHKICQQDAFVAPQLLLAQLLFQEDQTPSQELLTLQRNGLSLTHWRPYIHNTDPQQSLIRPWLPQIAHNLYQLIEHLHPHDPDEAMRLGMTINGFPWEQMPQTEHTAVEKLYLSLLRLTAHKEMKLLAEKLQRKMPASGQNAFWLGYVAYQFGKAKQSIEAFGKATQLGGLERHHMINMLPILLSEEQLAISRTLLDQLKLPETPPTLDQLNMEIEYCRLAREPERGLRCCEQILAIEPMHPPAHFYQAVWLDEDGQVAAAQRALEPLQEHELEEIRAFATLLLVGLDIKQEQFDQAAQRAKSLPPHEQSLAIFHEDEWRRTYLLNQGILFQQDQQYDKALALFEEALVYPPQEPVYGHILDFLCDQERYEEARTYGERALKVCPDAPRLRFAQCQIEDFFGNWERSLFYFDTIGFDWFVQEGHQLEGIYLKVRGLLGQQEPLQALHFCEDWLPEILADETLKPLRAQVLKEVDAQFQTLKAQVGKQHQRYQQLEETQRLLTRQREENRRRERAYQEILKKHEGLRQSFGRIGQATQHQPDFADALRAKVTIPALPQELTDNLPAHLQQILQSAQHLWAGLATHPDQDHGPVVLQLARVVEGQINDCLIDPFCQWTIAQGHSLSDLPRPSVTQLKAEQNRLSLGDAASLLYHTLQEQEPDGSTSTIHNPRSSSVHAEILTSFWERDIWQSFPPEQLIYLRDQLPRALRTLAKARNRASHAHQPIHRSEADTLRALVLGNDQQPGILAPFASASYQRIHQRTTP